MAKGWPRLPVRPIVSLLALAFVTRASAAPAGFAKWRDRARPIDGLSSFFDYYIGNCGDLFGRPQCEDAAATRRTAMEGQLFYVILDEEAKSSIRPVAFDVNRGQYRIDLTPYFEASGRALTDGEPKSQDENGKPRVRIIPF